MLKRNGILVGALYSVPILISLIFHAYLGSFSRLIADDFCSVSTIQRLGFLRSIRFWYLSWNGRYANSFVDGLLYVLDNRGIPLVVPFILLAWLVLTVFGVAWALPANLDKAEKGRVAIPVGALSVFCILLLSPSVPQSLYWWGGMRAYTLPLIFLALYVLVYLFFYQREQALFNLRRGIYLVSFMQAFFIAGFSETLSPALVVFMAGLVILMLAFNYVRFRSLIFYFLIAGLVGALVGLIVLVIAPGNAVRQAVFHRSTILSAFEIAFNSYRIFLVSWFSEAKSILGLCLLVLGGFWAGLAIQPSGSHQIQHSVAFLVFGLLLAYCCFLAAAYSMSNSSPERALITPAYFLANGILIGSFFVGQEFYTKFSRYPIVKTGIVGLLFLLMFISSSLNVSVLYSMRPAYVQYAHQWDEMDAYIRAEKIKGRTKVRILAKQNWVGLDEPKNKPHFWLNVCMSDYYGIQVLAPASDQP